MKKNVLKKKKKKKKKRGTHDVMVIIERNQVGYQGSNLRWGCLHFKVLIPLRKVWIQLFFL